jgi:hypothetical protein
MRNVKRLITVTEYTLKRFDPGTESEALNCDIQLTFFFINTVLYHLHEFVIEFHVRNFFLRTIVVNLHKYQ